MAAVVGLALSVLCYLASASCCHIWSCSTPTDARYDHHGDCQHFLATVAGPHGPVPAGTIRLVPSKGKLTRLAVLKEYRSSGAGATLVRAMEEWLVREAKAGRVGHLVKDGREGKSVHVKVHSQVSVAVRVVESHERGRRRGRGCRGNTRMPRTRSDTAHQCSCQIPVIRFYAKLGYKEEGPRFDEEGEPHQLMVRDIEF